MPEPRRSIPAPNQPWPEDDRWAAPGPRHPIHAHAVTVVTSGDSDGEDTPT